MLVSLIGNSAQSVLSFRATLIRRLKNNGHCVQALAPDYTPETAAAVALLGAEPIDYFLERSGTNPIADIRAFSSIVRHIRKDKPQAVLSYFVKPAIYGTFAALVAGTPRKIVMLEGLGYGFADDAGASFRRRWVSRAMRALLRLALHCADKVLVLNEDDLKVIKDELGVATDDAINIGGIGVELASFEPTAVRERAQVFALAARLIAEKGVYQYVAAARRVREAYPETIFFLLGEVDENPLSLRTDEIQEWVSEGLIEWPGRVSDIQAWLKRCDVFVLPSYYREGVPRSIQEAMALGRAIVTTDHVGCRDTVMPGVNGYLVPPKDVDCLTKAMMSLVETPGLARTMGIASRELAEERFDAERADRLVIGLLEADRYGS